MSDLQKLLAVLHTYEWSEMTLLQQTDLIYGARNELAAKDTEIADLRLQLTHYEIGAEEALAALAKADGGG